jgi:ERF superfamily protein
MAARKTKAVALGETTGENLPAVQQVLSFDQQLLRIAGDPRIPVARLNELAELRSKMRREDAEEAFNVAMVDCQREMRPVEADAQNESTKSKYATHYQVDKALRPIYSRYGFSLSFDTADGGPPDHTRVVCYVSRGLHTRRYQYDAAISTKGPRGNDVMTPTHAGASAFSYGKRYLELAIFNITIGDPGYLADDDGNAAGGISVVTPQQLQELIDLADQGDADKIRFCKTMKVTSMAAIPASRFEEAKDQLMRKIRKKAQADDFPGGQK